jgi:uncharacterized protein (UPF0332 family)
MSAAERIEEARELLGIAREQWDKAAVHSWEPSDPAECVTLSFYSYENAVEAAALVVGEPLKKVHSYKARLAAKLASQGRLKTDVSRRLVELNDLRKDVSYGEAGHNLSQTDLEDTVSDLESLIDEVNDLISKLEEEDAE